MAMPTEERRVVKKVVIQPDGTKKVIKKIIKKVPKHEGESAANPVVDNNPLTESPVETSMFSNPDSNVTTSSTDTDLFKDSEQSNQEPTISDTNTVPENITSVNENQLENPAEPVDSQLIAQNENQELTDIVPETTNTQENKTIDLWSIGFGQEPTPESSVTQEEAPAVQESATVENAWATTLDMDSLLWSTPTTETPQETANQSEVAQPAVEASASTENAATLNLDSMMQPQPAAETDNQESWEVFDPFMAMKTNVQEINSEQQATFNLDSLSEQPAPQVEQQATQPVAEAPVSETPTLDLNAMPSQAWTNPMESNIMQNLWGITADPKKKKYATIAAACLWVFVLALIAFIRYPDMFSWGQEHGVAPVDVSNPSNWGTTTTTQEPENPWTSEEPDVDTPTTPTTTQIDSEDVIKPKEPVVIDGDDFFSDDKDIFTVELDEVSGNLSTPSGSVDPLWEVTDLVGTINWNETIIQEALSYEEKGKALRDKWASEKNNNKIRYWTFVQGKARETIDALEKGENIDISTWTTLKAQLDEFLQKA